MSELVIKHKGGTGLFRQLLVTVSALALAGTTYEACAAREEGAAGDNPTVWIELGGQLNRLDETQGEFSPSIMTGRPSIFSPSGPTEKLPLYGFVETGKISIEPNGADWALSASIQYGRSSDHKSLHQQTHPADFIISKSGVPAPGVPPQTPSAARFAQTDVQNNESHFILDFQAGKDVGLGMFGRGSSATVSVGVRFAQFNTKSNISLKSDPDWHFSSKYFFGYHFPGPQPYHSNWAQMDARRSFHGIGPSLSWDANMPLVGSRETSEVTIDWGINAAVLFGRQRATTHHQTTIFYHSKSAIAHYRVVVPTPVTTGHSRQRNVVVPNIGGFAGASWRIQNFKASFGYRADFFFGAMDGGIDARNSENVGFHGPFATISIGLGG